MCLSNLMCISVSLHACAALVFDSLSAHDSERAMAVSIKVVNGERQTKGPPLHVLLSGSHASSSSAYLPIPSSMKPSVAKKCSRPFLSRISVSAIALPLTQSVVNTAVARACRFDNGNDLQAFGKGRRRLVVSSHRGSEEWCVAPHKSVN